MAKVTWLFFTIQILLVNIFRKKNSTVFDNLIKIIVEIYLTPFPSLTFRTIGGILDIYIFSGPTPVRALEQAQQVKNFTHFQTYKHILNGFYYFLF